MNALTDHCRDIATRARRAAIDLAGVASKRKATCLRAAADRIRVDADAILAANRLDLAAGYGQRTLVARPLASRVTESRSSAQVSEPEPADHAAAHQDRTIPVSRA